MGTRRFPSAPQWQVILEEIRSENHATLEAVLAFRTELGARIDRLDETTQGRDAIASLAIKDIQGQLRHHSSDLTELKRLSLEHGADIVELKDMGLQHGADIVELKDMGLRHGADIAELKDMGLRHGADNADLKGLGHRNSAEITERGVDIREIKLGLRESMIELRRLAQKVDDLRLEERVAALEKRAVGREGGSTPSSA